MLNNVLMRVLTMVLAVGADVSFAGSYFVHDLVVAYGNSVIGVARYTYLDGDGTSLVPRSVLLTAFTSVYVVSEISVLSVLHRVSSFLGT